MIALRELSPEEYGRIFCRPTSLYSTPTFCKMNSWKVAEVRYLCFEFGDEPLAGIILGRTDEDDETSPFRSPFSAPFGGLDAARELRVEEVCEIYTLLKDYLAPKGFKITLPPECYSPSLVARQIYALSALGASSALWLNHIYDLRERKEFETLLSDKMRQHLRRALRSSYEVDASPSLEEAYEVISRNRKERGYPLAMTLDELRATSAIIPQEYTVLRHEGQAVAAAICYRPAPEVVQLIYWGHLSECKGKYPMIALAREVYQRAMSSGSRILDLGPSTSIADPNDSLAAFKESVGALPTLKYIFGN